MRTKQDRIHNTWKKIHKKLAIVKAKNYCDDNSNEFIFQPHRLAKDKLERRYNNQHTNNKTKRHIHGNYQKTKNYSKSDRQKIDRMNYEGEENND